VNNIGYLAAEAAQGITAFLPWTMNASNHLLYLAERSSELFLTFDLKSGRFTYMNPTCIEFFDLDNKDIDSTLLLQMIHVNDQNHVGTNLDRCIAGEVISDIECRIVRGIHQRWLRITPFLFNENDQLVLIAQAEDITTIKDHSEVLNNHNSRKNNILTMLAHDLAGPLGAIQNFTALLDRETKNFNNPKLEKFISSIERITKNSIHLIHTFIDQEFLESADVKLLKKRVDVLEKIKLGVTTYIETETDLDITFDVKANHDHIYVEIDEDKFLQVINNLISNALKFTPKGGSININLQEKEESVMITISDTGIGIPKAFHNTLFEKFTSARRRGLKGEVSTGLGMSIIKTIVEWHGGSIWFESEENVGTTFFIEIPKA
jgi:two-component system sensor histidine kinase VicK